MSKFEIINEFEFFSQSGDKEKIFEINEIENEFKDKYIDSFYLEDENIDFEDNLNNSLTIIQNNNFEILDGKNSMQQVKQIIAKKIEVKFGGRYFSK